jgi:hypothetical protein
MVNSTPRPLYPREESSLYALDEAGWAPEPVWTTWRVEKSYPYGDSNCDPSDVQLLASRYTDCAVLIELND